MGHVIAASCKLPQICSCDHSFCTEYNYIFSTSFRSYLLAIIFQYTNLQGIQISAYKILVILQGKENQLVTLYSLKCWVVGAEWEQTLLS